MRLAVFSDPHVDIQEKRGYPNFINELNEYLKHLNPDIILVTGDVASSIKYIQKFLQGIDIDCKMKIFCPGNHDIWVNSRSFDASWAKYYQVLPELCRKQGWHYLPRQPVIVENIAFAGTMGWYDYSSRNPKWDRQITFEEYATKYNKASGAMWMDSEHAKFGNHDDIAIADHLAHELIEDIKQISSNLIVDNSVDTSQLQLNFDRLSKSIPFKPQEFDTLIIGTHIVPFLDFVKFTGKLEWDYFSAFIGNPKLGEIITKISADVRKISVFGHTHFPFRKLINGNIEAICCPIGYPHEWEKHCENLRSLFNQRIIDINL